MLTVVTVPRGFDGPAAVIQRNAIMSWRRIAPGSEIILFGDEPGVDRAAQLLGVRHEPEVTRSPFGTPLLDGVFARAERIARHDMICYVNADIILLEDFVRALRRVRRDRFLLTGRRWEVDLDAPVDFERSTWQEDLRTYATRTGRRAPHYAADYFVYCRGSIGPVPPFAVGRPHWDNWMIFNARCRGLAVVDASAAVTAIHQNHDDGHWPRASDGTVPEEQYNYTLAGPGSTCGLEAATHVVTDRGVRWVARPGNRLKHAMRRVLPEALGGYPRQRRLRVAPTARFGAGGAPGPSI